MRSDVSVQPSSIDYTTTSPLSLPDRRNYVLKTLFRVVYLLLSQRASHRFFEHRRAYAHRNRALVWSHLVMCGCAMLLIMPAISSAEDRNSISVTAPREPARSDDSFIRMFPGLPPFAPATDEVREKAKKLGAKDGILDAKDLMSDPIQSILNPAVFSPNNPDNPNMTAGVTFLGQFIDHDLTLDLKSPLLQAADPRRTTNFRTAAFDLDSVYGTGPQGSPELYDQGSGDIKFRIEAIPGSETVSRKGAVRLRRAARCQQHCDHRRQPQR